MPGGYLTCSPRDTFFLHKHLSLRLT